MHDSSALRSLRVLKWSPEHEAGVPFVRTKRQFLQRSLVCSSLTSTSLDNCFISFSVSRQYFTFCSISTWRLATLRYSTRCFYPGVASIRTSLVGGRLTLSALGNSWKKCFEWDGHIFKNISSKLCSHESLFSAKRAELLNLNNFEKVVIVNVLLEIFPNMKRMDSKMYFSVQVRHGSEDWMTNPIPSRWSIPSIRIQIQMSYYLFALNIEI